LDGGANPCEFACPLRVIVFGLELGALPLPALAVEFPAHRLARVTEADAGGDGQGERRATPPRPAPTEGPRRLLYQPPCEALESSRGGPPSRLSDGLGRPPLGRQLTTLPGGLSAIDTGSRAEQEVGKLGRTFTARQQEPDVERAQMTITAAANFAEHPGLLLSRNFKYLGLGHRQCLSVSQLV